jgi:transcription termination/antitermination protein NusG
VIYYIIQVQTRQEEKFLRAAKKLEQKYQGTFLLPRRSLRIRRKGQWRESLALIFPGYVFLQMEKVPNSLYWAVKELPGFIRFLKNNRNIIPMEGKDKDILVHFLSFGEVMKRSEVFFTSDKKMAVKNGPLMGLEGLIVKVDKRKKRVKLRLEMYRDSYLVDFGYEDLLDPSGPLEKEPVPDGETGLPE